MQDLITSKRLESMVFNPELMSESNWAYLTSMEVVKDIQEDINLFSNQQQPVGGQFGAQMHQKGQS